jgi:hypothetical protein
MRGSSPRMTRIVLGTGPALQRTTPRGGVLRCVRGTGYADIAFADFT